MKEKQLLVLYNCFWIFTSLLCSSFLSAQEQINPTKHPIQLHKKVQFGGGLGLNFGTGYSSISLAPSAIYNFNSYLALGLGAQYSYTKQKDFYSSNLYGMSCIALLNLIREIQLSAEIEQVRVHLSLYNSALTNKSFWNTGLFIGAGYRSGNATVGVRYNVLPDTNTVYGTGFIPFVRFYF